MVLFLFVWLGIRTREGLKRKKQFSELFLARSVQAGTERFALGRQAVSMHGKAVADGESRPHLTQRTPSDIKVKYFAFAKCEIMC